MKLNCLICNGNIENQPITCKLCHFDFHKKCTLQGNSQNLTIDSLDFTCNTCQQQSIPFNCLKDEDFSKTIGSTDTSIEQLTKKEINRLQKISVNPFKLNSQKDNHLLIDDNDIESALLRKVNDRISECDYYLV